MKFYKVIEELDNMLEEFEEVSEGKGHKDAKLLHQYKLLKDAVKIIKSIATYSNYDDYQEAIVKDAIGHSTFLLNHRSPPGFDKAPLDLL